MESLYIAEPATAEPKPLKIKLLETPPDERRNFVECALDLLVQSRFGPAPNLSEIDDLCELFEPERYVEHDLTARCRHRPHAVFGVRALRASQRGRRILSASAAIKHNASTTAAFHVQRMCNALTPCGLMPSNHSPPILGPNATDL